MDLSDLYKKAGRILTSTHRVAFYSILWFTEGNGTHLVDFEPVQVKQNLLLFLNKHTVQRFDPSGNFAGKAIIFTDAFFGKEEAMFLQQFSLFNTLFSTSVIDAGTLFPGMIGQIADEITMAPDEYQAQILRNMVYNFLLFAEREKKKQQPHPVRMDADHDLVLQFSHLVDAEFSSQQLVGYYAKKLSVADRKLNAATTKILGKSAKDIIIDRVILEAKRLLAHSSKSAKEIAYDLGFGEPTYFVQYFKKHTKMTPSAFSSKYKAYQ